MALTASVQVWTDKAFITAHDVLSLTTKDLPGGLVRSADVKTKDNTVDVTLKDGTKYQIGFVPGAAAATLIWDKPLTTSPAAYRPATAVC